MTALDERLGRLLRLIRRRAGLTQEDLAKAARVSVEDIARVEHGDAGLVRLDQIRRLFTAVGGQARLTAWWNGASADRLLDEKHAGLVERAASLYRARHWDTAIEVSFNEYGDRGSIDLLAGHRATAAVAVNEVKSAFGSLEETNRSLDVKERLASKIAVARFGWRPRVVGRVLILPDERTARRVVATHSETMSAIYPGNSRAVRAWLRDPDRPIRAIWFLSDPAVRRTHSTRQRLGDDTARESRDLPMDIARTR